MAPIANDVNHQSINVSTNIITNKADWYREAANLSIDKTVGAIVGKKSSSC